MRPTVRRACVARLLPLAALWPRFVAGHDALRHVVHIEVRMHQREEAASVEHGLSMLQVRTGARQSARLQRQAAQQRIQAQAGAGSSAWWQQRHGLHIRAVPPKGQHTHTVIILHGLYCRASDFDELPGTLRRLGVQDHGVKYIFPNSPLIELCWEEGPELKQPAWYTYLPDSWDSDFDVGQFATNSERVRSIIDDEAKKLGSASRVIVGGNSQGGTIAAEAAMAYPEPLGGLIFLRSDLLANTKVNTLNARMPIFIFRGANDHTFVASETNRSFRRLTDAGFHVELHDEPGLKHQDDSKNELAFAAKWIAHAFFGQEVEVTHHDLDDMVQPKRTVGEHRGRLRADLKAGRVADCHEGARCCGECCIGSSVQVTFPYGSELTGEYSGSYNGTVVAFAAPVAVTSTNWAANSEMSRILVQYDNPKDEVKKWAFWPRRGDQPGGCGYTASASLSEIGDSRGPMAGRQRWEYAHSVTAAGKFCSES